MTGEKRQPEQGKILIGRTLVATGLLLLEPYAKKPVVIHAMQVDKPFKVKTIEGVMTGHTGDFLIRGVEGEFYPCAQSIFRKTYKKVVSKA